MHVVEPEVQDVVAAWIVGHLTPVWTVTSLIPGGEEVKRME